MFWQIILFIVIVTIGSFFRAFLKKEDTGYYSILLFLVLLGTEFYIAFAIQWSLLFLLDFRINYWILLGLLFVYKSLIRKLN